MRTESDWLADSCYVTDTANNIPRSQPCSHTCRAVRRTNPVALSMVLPWPDSEIESAIRLVFAKLGYEEVRSEQLDATREFVKNKDVFVSPLEAVSPYAVDVYSWCLTI